MKPEYCLLQRAAGAFISTNTNLYNYYNRLALCQNVMKFYSGTSHLGGRLVHKPGSQIENKRHTTFCFNFVSNHVST